MCRTAWKILSPSISLVALFNRNLKVIRQMMGQDYEVNVSVQWKLVVGRLKRIDRYRDKKEEEE